MGMELTDIGSWCSRDTPDFLLRWEDSFQDGKMRWTHMQSFQYGKKYFDPTQIYYVCQFSQNICETKFRSRVVTAIYHKITVKWIPLWFENISNWFMKIFHNFSSSVSSEIQYFNKNSCPHRESKVICHVKRYVKLFIMTRVVGLEIYTRWFLLQSFYSCFTHNRISQSIGSTHMKYPWLYILVTMVNVEIFRRAVSSKTSWGWMHKNLSGQSSFISKHSPFYQHSMFA